jgi:hypothetical protein
MAKRRTKKRAGRRRKGRKGGRRRTTKRRKKRGGGAKMVCPKTVGGKRVTASKGRCWLVTKTPVPKISRQSVKKKACVAKKYSDNRKKGMPAHVAARQAKAAC